MVIDLETLDRKAAADDELNRVTAIFMGLFHVGAIAALFSSPGKLSWSRCSCGGFRKPGIGMGYHRLLTHRGYKTPKWGRVCLDHLRHTCSRRRADLRVATHRIHHNIPIRRAIRTRPATASGGHIWDGF